MQQAIRRAGFVLSLAAGSALAQPSPETQDLRRELDALRTEYERRIQALEQRLKAAEAAVAAQPPAATAAAPTPAPAAAEPAAAAPAIAVTPSAPAAPKGGGFQPAISLILSGQYGQTQRDPASYRIRGFPLPPDAEIGPGTRGFSLNETELSLSANIDPWFRGVANFAFAADNSVSVEEAYVQTTSLGKGLTLRGGRFLSGIGYLNAQHAHTWDFADAPLAYQAMLGTQFGDDGLQLNWVAPTDRLIELRGELGRGRSFPGSDRNNNGAGMASLSAHMGDDIGESHSWRAGVSYLRAKAADQPLLAPDAAGSEVSNAFTGNTRVWIADAVWKWAPNGNATRTNFKLQGEYLRSTRDGSLVVDTAGLASDGTYRVTQSGWYLQGVYQFMPRWRVGLRTERLDGGSPDYGANNGLLAVDTGNARKHTLMLDYNPSEFSRIRFQVAQDRARVNLSDWQWLIQYQMSLGAHGAHSY
jgi:nucleoid-associated protein YgaU